MFSLQFFHLSPTCFNHFFIDFLSMFYYLDNLLLSYSIPQLLKDLNKLISFIKSPIKFIELLFHESPYHFYRIQIW